MAMRNFFSTFWIAILIFRVPKCEVVNFNKYSLACLNSMSTKLIPGVPHIHRAAGLPAVRRMHDVTAFALRHGMM